MLFELLKVVEEVEITDRTTQEKKKVKVTSFFLKNDEVGKLIRIEPHTAKYKDGGKYTNKDILSALAIFKK